MKKLAITLVLASFLFSCTMDEQKGTISLDINSEIMLLKSSEKKPALGVQVNDFQLSFTDLDFNHDKSNLDWKDLEFYGPFEFDLLDYSKPLTQNIGITSIKEGLYKALGLNLYSFSQSAPLNNRSLFLSGFVDGIPFEFWHNTNEIFKIINSNGILIDCNQATVLISFDIDKFFSAINVIHLNVTLDKNNDGVIQINPNNDDGNGFLADMIKENIFASVYMTKQ